MTTENKTIRQFNFVVVCEVTEIDGVEYREWFLDDERTYVFLKNHGVYDYEDLDGTPRDVKPEEMPLYNEIEDVISSMLNDQTQWEKEK